MDPTEHELGLITNLDEACAWAGVDGNLRTSLEAALGNPGRMREIALIQRPSWDATIGALQVTTPAVGDVAAFNTPLTPVQEARVESLRRVCFLRMGRDPDLPGGAAPIAPAPGAPALGVVPGQPAGARKLKLAAVLDPTLDAEITPLTQREMSTMYDQYRTKFGDFPSPDADISPDQLSALAQVIRAGAAPFADFSIFGPYGQRLLRRQTFTSYQLSTATGEWQKREQPGPADYHAWHQCYKVYRTGMLLLEAADAERLDAYGEHVRSFVTQFSEEAWFIVARADSRMRSEHLDRLRRELRTDPAFGFTEGNPWSACLAKAVKDGDFWNREVVTPATLWLSRAKKEVATNPHHDGDSPGGGPKKRKRANRHYKGEDMSKKGADGHYTHNRKGHEICKLFGKGKCSSKAAQSKCKNGRSHQCSLCLGPHMSSECTSGAAKTD